MRYFLLSDLLDLQAFIVDCLACLISFFDVVKSLDLLFLHVRAHLSPNTVSMASARLQLLLIEASLFLLFGLLALDEAQEFVSLHLGHKGKALLLVVELLDAGDFELFDHLRLVDLLSSLLVPRLTLVLLCGALGPESVNLRLSVGSALLQLSELLDFSFFLFSQALGGLDFGLFSGSFVSLVIEDVLLEYALILLLLLLECKSMFV